MDAYTSPNYDRACLITIDVQNDFVRRGASGEVPGSLQVIPHIVAALNAWRQQGKPIVHLVRSYLPDGSDADQCRRSLIERGSQLVAPHTAGAHLYPDISPHGNQALDWESLRAGTFVPIASNEYVCYHPRWSAFYRTQLEHFLSSHMMDTVVVCGCNFPNSPRATIYDASARDFRIVLLHDATSLCNQQGIEDLDAIGVHIMTTDDWLRGPGSGRVQIIPPN